MYFGLEVPQRNVMQDRCVQFEKNQMERIIELNEYDIVKYLKSTYLVKSFRQFDNGKYQLKYHFRTIRKENAKLHKNKKDELYECDLEKIKKADEKEREFLILRILSENPDFDLSKLEKDTQKKKSELNEENCIEFLKDKGYLIYKQQ